jgi:hypothetical protein
MNETNEDFQALRDVVAESVNLEFKAGAKLENMGDLAQVDLWGRKKTLG